MVTTTQEPSLDYVRLYWMRGTAPKGVRTDYDVKDPPCLGFARALVLRGEKRSVIFCPFSFTSYQVRNHCAELELSEPVSLDTDWMLSHMREKWDKFQTIGMNLDYDTAALIFKRLGATVPEQLLRGGEEDTRQRGGKTVAVLLAKPVKRNGKRGQFLQWFMDGGGTRSVREAMAQFSMTRSNALSYLFMLNKDHGIGYELIGDNAVLHFPEGCTDPFATELPAEDTYTDDTQPEDDGNSLGLDDMAAAETDIDDLGLD